MRSILLSLLLLATPAVAKKPNVDALSASAAKQPADAIADLDAALLKAKSDKDVAVLHALRAQALATASLDGEWAGAHGDWLTEVLGSLRASTEADAGGAHALKRTMAVQRVVESVTKALFEERELASETAPVLGALAAMYEQPWLHNLAALIHLRGGEVSAGLTSHRKAAELVTATAPSEDGVAVTLSAAQHLGLFVSGLGGADPNDVAALYAAVAKARAHLSEVSSDDLGEIERYLVWAPMVLVGLESPDHTVAAARAYLAGTPDAEVWTALGQFLELQAGGEGAEEAYRSAVAVDPDRLGPRLSLGLFYVNRIQGPTRALLELPIEASADALQSEIRDLNEKAREQLEHAHRIAPDDVTAVMGLVQVCAALDDLESYKAYKAKLMVLRGQ